MDTHENHIDSLETRAAQFTRGSHLVGGLKRGLIDFFLRPKRTLGTGFPIEMDGGSVGMFQGFRCIHSNVEGLTVAVQGLDAQPGNEGSGVDLRTAAMDPGHRTPGTGYTGTQNLALTPGSRN